MTKLKVFFETFGCQMNKLDSETATERLLNDGFESTANIADADVILFNTCSVREHAEERVYSRIGTLKHLKYCKPWLVIGVMGCMAQKDGSIVFRRTPLVNLVCGPQNAARLGQLIAQARTGKRVLALDGGDRIRVRAKPPKDVVQVSPEQETHHSFSRNGSKRLLPHQAYAAIMFGCDNFCTYCIVPYVRGQEQSRPMDEIAEEVQRLAESGVKEVILLGQNVNSYSGGLPALLHHIHDTPGIERIRFVTSHPKDVSDELLHTMAELPKVCEHLHAPAQAGSNAVLERMNRRYTREHYLKMLDRARNIMPGIEFACDFIVGFPGETEEDFQQTVDLVRRADFGQCYIFKYSPRAGTKAAELDDDVPEEVKKRRNNELLAVQEAISARCNREKHGSIVEVLVDGASKNDARKLTGRSRGNDIIVFDGPRSLVGCITPVRITDSTPLTLFGKLVRQGH